jgi:signal transduction protein with GAF and PtsI domain
VLALATDPEVRRPASAPTWAPSPTAPARESEPPAARPSLPPAAAENPRTIESPHIPAATRSTRLRGEDLVADLFEVMHELHFLRDALEGGDFCLAAGMEKIPSESGFVHLYNIDRREFIITSTRGARAGALLLRRHGEGEKVLATAMRRRRPVVIADAAHGEAASVERYAAVGGARSVIVAPVMQAGRFLGAIELLNPLDGHPFTSSDGDAVGYIASQFAEFVASRGVVTDPERISARRPRA